MNLTETRLTKSEYGCYLALAARSRSEDPHTQVGTVLFDEDWRTVSTGFNGFAPQLIPHDDIIQNRPLKSDLINHAEINAILYSSRQPYYACMVYSPCIHCAKTIAASKIKEIYFLKQYRKSNSETLDVKYMDIFNFSGIKYNQLSIDSLNKILFWIDKDKEFIKSLI
jgi:deoxycytidylate deaminase